MLKSRALAFFVGLLLMVSQFVVPTGAQVRGTRRVAQSSQGNVIYAKARVGAHTTPEQRTRLRSARPEGPTAVIDVLDTDSNADFVTITGSTPVTYIGDGFTNNALPAGTGSFQVTEVDTTLWSQAAANYTNVRIRVQFWNLETQGATPVFSFPAGPLIVADLGPYAAPVGDDLQPVTLDLSASPVTLNGGNGHHWGITINYQGNTGSGLADTNNLTTAIAYSESNSAGYAAGSITTGTSPAFGWYRNASGRTDLNFAAGDSRTFSGIFFQGMDMIISGNALPATAANASVSGVVTVDGMRGLTNAVVTITDDSGASQSVITGRSGAFSFDNVATGKTYVVTVGSRRFSFSPQTVTVSDNVSGLTFTPE